MEFYYDNPYLSKEKKSQAVVDSREFVSDECKNNSHEKCKMSSTCHCKCHDAVLIQSEWMDEDKYTPQKGDSLRVD